MKKIMVSIIAVAAISSSTLMGGGINDFANSVIYSVEAPTAISTKDRTILYGGGATLKAPNITLTPFNIKAPSAKAGCGGIDLTFGSLSFLDSDQMVQFAEGIMANAAGVAFDLALKTLCPSCSETLKALESMANQINQMSLDSCNVATELGNIAVDSFIGEGTKEDLKNGTVNTYMKGLTNNYINPATKGLSKFNTSLDSFGANKPKVLRFFTQTASPTSPQSFIEYIFPDGIYYDPTIRTVIKSIIGDVVIKQSPSGDTAGLYTPIYSLETSSEALSNKYNDNNFESNTEKIINRLIGATTGTPKIYDSSFNKVDANFAVGTLVEQYKTNITSIATSMSLRTAPTTTDITFLSRFRFPVYKIFNALGGTSYGGSIIEEVKEPMAKMLASQIIYEYLIQISQEIQMQISQAETFKKEFNLLPYSGVSGGASGNNEFIEHLKAMAKDNRYALGISYAIYTKSYNEFLSALATKSESIKNAYEIKRMTISRTSPDIFMNYTMSSAFAGKQ